MNSGERVGFILGGLIALSGSLLCLWVSPLIPAANPNKALADGLLMIPGVGGIVGVIVGIFGGKSNQNIPKPKP
ncbi:hypothetical protein LCGC14_0543490 [marine sediment metagenome]|uniref:Uncharacterized protein n=1 Tax=marine sediment metagenome TaxID=412755 RepID=A0A0F9RRZ9_9ZZZZ